MKEKILFAVILLGVILSLLENGLGSGGINPNETFTIDHYGHPLICSTVVNPESGAGIICDMSTYESLYGAPNPA